MNEILVVVAQGLLPAMGAVAVLVGILGRRFVSIAIASGVFAAYSLLKQLPAWPHRLWVENNDGTQWWIWSLVAAALLATFEGSRTRPARSAFVLWCAVLGAQVWLMLTNRRTNWDASTTALHTSIGAFALCLMCVTFRSTLAKPAPRLQLWAWTACLGVDAGVLALGGSVLLGQLAGALAAALGTVAALRLVRNSVQLVPGTALTLAAGHGGILFAGYHFTEPPLTALLAAACAPCCLGIAALPGMRRRPRLALPLAAISCAACLAVALVTAIKASSGSGY